MSIFSRIRCGTRSVTSVGPVPRGGRTQPMAKNSRMRLVQRRHLQTSERVPMH